MTLTELLESVRRVAVRTNHQKCRFLATGGRNWRNWLEEKTFFNGDGSGNIGESCLRNGENGREIGEDRPAIWGNDREKGGGRPEIGGSDRGIGGGSRKMGGMTGKLGAAIQKIREKPCQTEKRFPEVGANVAQIAYRKS